MNLAHNYCFYILHSTFYSLLSTQQSVPLVLSSCFTRHFLSNLFFSVCTHVVYVHVTTTCFFLSFISMHFMPCHDESHSPSKLQAQPQLQPLLSLLLSLFAVAVILVSLQAFYRSLKKEEVKSEGRSHVCIYKLRH